MRARKRNPFWGMGLDLRQARRMRRRETRFPVRLLPPAQRAEILAALDRMGTEQDEEQFERDARLLSPPCQVHSNAGRFRSRR